MGRKISSFVSLLDDPEGEWENSEQDIRDYWMFRQQIGEIPRLKKKEVLELIGRIQSGERDLEPLLLENFFYFAVKTAKYFVGKGVLYADLVQEGVMGISKAIHAFDQTKADNIYAYLWYYTANGMIRLIKEHVVQPDSLNRWDKEQEDWRISLIPSNDEEAPDEIAINTTCLRDSIEDALEMLQPVFKPRQEEILRLRFGLNGEAKLHKEIAGEFGVSSPRIGQLCRGAVNKLKHPGVSKYLRDYYY